MGGKKVKKAPSTKGTKIEFNLHKAPYHRTFHVDGIYGGLTPDGKLSIDFFNQNFPLPTATIHEMVDLYTVGKEIGRKGDKPRVIERLIETRVMMDISVAKTFRTWIDGKIKEYDKIVNPALKEKEE